MVKLYAAACAAGILLTLVPAGATAARPTQAGPLARATTCDRNTYQSKVRTVSGTTSIGISRMWVKTYPGKTTVHQGKTITTDHNRTLKAGVSTTVGASMSAGAMLKKVVNVFGEAHAETNYRVSVGSTVGESKTVVNDETVVIPGGKTVVWFVGHKRVSGTYRYSSCDYSAEEPKDTGHVNWHTAKWFSFSIREDGGQRCDLKGNTSVARAAKRVGCS